MAEAIFHGAKVHEPLPMVGSVPRVDTAVSCMWVTAPDADDATFPYHIPIVISDPTILEKAGDSGTLKSSVQAALAQVSATNVVIRVPHSEDINEQISHFVGDESKKTGIHALKRIGRTQLGVEPTEWAAPNFTSPLLEDNTGKNPIVAAMEAEAEKMRAHIYMDTAGVEGTAAGLDIRSRYNNSRIYICDNPVVVWDNVTSSKVVRPASPYFIGVQQKMDLNIGPHKSLSNQQILGIMEPLNDVYHLINDNNCESSILNRNGVGTIVHGEAGGFITWGNLAAKDVGDEWQFWCVRRNADRLYRTIERLVAKIIDQSSSVKVIRNLNFICNEYLKQETNLEYLIGGAMHNRIVFDKDLNSITRAMNGEYWWKLTAEFPTPMQGINVQAERSPEAFAEFISQVAG